MKKYINLFISSFLAGLLIAIGGIVYLSTKQTSIVMAAFLFAFGLFTIINFKLDLFTGKVGYIFDNKPMFLFDLVIILLGNATSSILSGYILRSPLLLNDSRLSSIITNSADVSNIKLNSSWLSILILSIFCGVMIYLAVEVSKREFHPLIKVVTTFFAIAIFILCGFEHCIANMFYFSLANVWCLKTILYILIMIIGNSIGSLLIYWLLKIVKK